MIIGILSIIVLGDSIFPIFSRILDLSIELEGIGRNKRRTQD